MLNVMPEVLDLAVRAAENELQMMKVMAPRDSSTQIAADSTLISIWRYYTTIMAGPRPTRQLSRPQATAEMAISGQDSAFLTLWTAQASRTCLARPWRSDLNQYPRES